MERRQAVRGFEHRVRQPPLFVANSWFRDKYWTRHGEPKPHDTAEVPAAFLENIPDIRSET